MGTVCMMPPAAFTSSTPAGLQNSMAFCPSSLLFSMEVRGACNAMVECALLAAALAAGISAPLAGLLRR